MRATGCILNNAVKVTFGPKGRNVVLDKSFGAPRITKDGVTVAKEIQLYDKFENMGAQMVREVASKTSDNAGDGTTTATVLATSIMKEGIKLVAAGMNPMDLKRGIDIAVKAVVKNMERRSKKVQSSDEVAQVGTISANGDVSIGKMIAEAMQARRSATPPPGTMPSSTAAFVACIASSTRSFFSLTSTSVEPPTRITATPRPEERRARPWPDRRCRRSACRHIPRSGH